MAGCVCVFGRRSPDQVAYGLSWELDGDHYEDWRRNEFLPPSPREREALRVEERCGGRPD